MKLINVINCDNEIDLISLNMKINELKKELGLTNSDIAELFDLSPIAYANSSAKSRYEAALCRFFDVVKEKLNVDEKNDLNNP